MAAKTVTAIIRVMDRYLSTLQAAERLGVTPMRVRQWITDGILPADRVARDYVIRVEDVEVLYTKRAEEAKRGRRRGRPPGSRNRSEA